jgi:hypothetical protein
MPHCVFLSHPQSRDSGDYQHRVTLPARALARHWSVEDLQTSHPRFVERALRADLLIVCMVAEPVIARLVQARNAAGRPTAYEISDDFGHFPRTVPGHSFYRQPKTRRVIGELAAASTLVQFSSHGLRQAYGHLNPRQAVFANQLDALPPLAPRCIDPGVLPVLGWAGSTGHADDAMRLATLLRDWASRRLDHGHELPVLRLMCSPLIARLFDGCGLHTELYPTGDFETYLGFLSGLDVGFACIGDDRFSLGRSDGKFIEMASRGAVCVASDLGEYRYGIDDGRTGLRFADAQGFGCALDSLVDDPAARMRIRSAAYDHVARHRLHTHGALERIAVYGALPGLHREPAVRRPGGDGVSAAVPAPAAAGRAIDDQVAERVLAAALRHREGRHDIALDLYVACMQDAPDFYLPWERASLIARALGSGEEGEVLASLAQRKLQQAIDAASPR